MIKKLSLNNFKSHKNTVLDFSNLTVLCGENGVGKSSIIQSLLLLRQTFFKNRLNHGLDLNKPLCEIGSSQDIFYQFADSNNLGISFKYLEDEFSWNFKFNDKNSNATFMDIESFNGNADELKNINLFNNNFQFLSAARLAPRESYPKDDYEVKNNRQISIEKGQGELVAHFLDNYQKEKIAFELCRHCDCEYDDLLSQTTAWEREISKNINVKVLPKGSSFEIKYNFDSKRSSTYDFRSENVGFGVSYVLPIIVAILSAKPNSLLLIENPEAHLHPYAQSKLAELICLAAESGVQFVIETHSDHILNGILLSTKHHETGRNGVNKSNVKIYNFTRDFKQHSVKYDEIKILGGGKIDIQPEGFFDQIQKDMKAIMGF